jgi:hypothetical protein
MLQGYRWRRDGTPRSEVPRGQVTVPRSRTSLVTEVKGVEYLVHAGEVLPPNHPVVRARPELFEPEVGDVQTPKSSRRSAK